MATNNLHEITREGYNDLNAELEHLITVERKEIGERLKEAISLGDISENAEYDAAKEAQAEIEDRINEIDAMLRTAKVIDADNLGGGDDDGAVQTGRFVTIKNLDTDVVAEYQIVGSSEADPFKGKLSNACEVGKHLIGLKAGEQVSLIVPDGKVNYEVLEVK